MKLFKRIFGVFWTNRITDRFINRLMNHLMNHLMGRLSYNILAADKDQIV
jgi:hypothetical protein